MGTVKQKEIYILCLSESLAVLLQYNFARERRGSVVISHEREKQPQDFKEFSYCCLKRAQRYNHNIHFLHIKNKIIVVISWGMEIEEYGFKDFHYWLSLQVGLSGELQPLFVH